MFLEENPAVELLGGRRARPRIRVSLSSGGCGGAVMAWGNYDESRFPRRQSMTRKDALYDVIIMFGTDADYRSRQPDRGPSVRAIRQYDGLSDAIASEIRSLGLVAHSLCRTVGTEHETCHRFHHNSAFAVIVDVLSILVGGVQSRKPSACHLSKNSYFCNPSLDPSVLSPLPFVLLGVPRSLRFESGNGLWWVSLMWRISQTTKR